MEVLAPIIVFIVAIIIFSIIVKKLWPYLVIRLFPGAVDQNLIAREISWKVSIILAIIIILNV